MYSWQSSPVLTNMYSITQNYSTPLSTLVSHGTDPSHHFTQPTNCMNGEGHKRTSPPHLGISIYQ